MNANGVKLSKTISIKLKQEILLKQLREAAKMAGLKMKDWIATQTLKLKENRIIIK